MITVTVTNRIEITGCIPGQVQATIEDRLTFPNPAHEEAERRGFSTWNIDREIKGYSLDGDMITVARGFTRQLVGLLNKSGV